MYNKNEATFAVASYYADWYLVTVSLDVASYLVSFSRQTLFEERVRLSLFPDLMLS